MRNKRYLKIVTFLSYIPSIFWIAEGRCHQSSNTLYLAYFLTSACPWNLRSKAHLSITNQILFISLEVYDRHQNRIQGTSIDQVHHIWRKRKKIFVRKNINKLICLYAPLLVNLLNNRGKKGIGMKHYLWNSNFFPFV